MTIKLFDTLAQKEYQQELETYDARITAAQQAGGMWPMDLQYPRPPEPMINSRDPGLDPSSRNPGALSYPTPALVGSDPRPMDPVDLDGTSQSNVKGFDSRWSTDHDADFSPFKTTKG